MATRNTACATGCTRPAPDAHLCRDCTTSLRSALTMAASIAPDLDDAIARQLRHGGSGKRSGEQPLPVDLRASHAASMLRIVLADVTGRLAAEDGKLPYRAMGIAALARWLTGQLTRIVVRADAGGIHRDVTGAVDQAVRVLEPPPDRDYCGPCTRCGADLLSAPGAGLVACLACGQDHEVAEQIDAMVAVVRDLLGTAQWCATASTALGSPVSDSAVRMWALRDRLVPRGQRPSAKGAGMVALYRVGDVMELADFMTERKRKQRA